MIGGGGAGMGGSGGGGGGGVGSKWWFRREEKLRRMVDGVGDIGDGRVSGYVNIKLMEDEVIILFFN